ncbi:MAG: BON domain-containing protein [bacterium]
MNSTNIRVLVFLFMISITTGCAVVAVGAAAVTITDRRTTGTILDDQQIEVRARTILNKQKFENTHFVIVSYNRNVLLAGEVSNQQQSNDAERLIYTINNVNKVLNELTISEPSTISTRSHDSYLTAKVKTAMLKVEEPTFDPGRIKVVTIQSKVYLFGLLTNAEQDEVVTIASQVNGVKEVIKVIKLID